MFSRETAHASYKIGARLLTFQSQRLKGTDLYIRDNLRSNY